MGGVVNVTVPQVGESVTEVTLVSWAVSNGDRVEEGMGLCEIESDKANLEIPAEASGIITLEASEGSELKIGALLATITPGGESQKKIEEPAPVEAEVTSKPVGGHPSPAAKKIMAEKGIDPSSVVGTGRDGRITKADALNTQESIEEAPVGSQENSRNKRREKMTRLRKTIAARLTEAKNTTAMLTTFNEVDMTGTMNLRKTYNEEFLKKYGVKLGFMSLFTKACCLGLKEVPGIGAQIEGDEIIYHDYCDMGIAVSTPKGLVVPVIRNAESLSLAQIEIKLKDLALRAREGKLSLDEMKGGTFTLTNGGVFGSMLSTPILNIPQSAILGMHNIVDRPVVHHGSVTIRPIMYTALSYDHRIVDGRESVTFLRRVKEFLEDPARMLLSI